MKVLITGASGFLGRLISSTFPKKDTITLGRRPTNALQYDLSSHIPHLPNVDLVVHVAGKAHIVASNSEEEQMFFDVNVKGTANLLKGLELCAQFPKAFVFISSVSVYGLNKGVLISEDSALLAVDPYGKSKIEAEQIISDWCNKHNVICTILRLPILAGPNPLGNLKAMIEGIKKGFYVNIAGGGAKKSMVLAEDVAKIIPKAAEIGGIYNLTDGHHPSFSDLADYISTQLGKAKPISIPFFLAKILAKFGDLLGAKSPLNTSKLNKISLTLTFDDTKAKRLLNWQPKRVIDGFKIQ